MPAAISSGAIGRKVEGADEEVDREGSDGIGICKNATFTGMQMGLCNVKGSCCRNIKLKASKRVKRIVNS